MKIVARRTTGFIPTYAALFMLFHYGAVMIMDGLQWCDGSGLSEVGKDNGRCRFP